MNIRSSPTFTWGKKHNIRLICFGLWLVCKSLTKEQWNACFCAVLHRKRRKPQWSRGSKDGVPVGASPSHISQGWSCTANDYSCTTLLCNTKMAKITVIARTFIPPKASFWVLGVSFVLNPLCLQGSICSCCGFLPLLSEYNNEGKIPCLLLSEVIMENCRNLSGAVRCLQCLQKIITQNIKANFSRLKKKKSLGT